MVSKHCWFRDQGCRLQCQSQTVQLKDEKGFVFPVRFDRWCRMHIFNSRELSLLDHLERLKDSGISLLRVEGRTKDPNWIGQVVTAYKRRLAGEEVHLAGEFTKGHYFRGVL
jgi:putative protease